MRASVSTQHQIPGDPRVVHPPKSTISWTSLVRSLESASSVEQLALSEIYPSHAWSEEEVSRGAELPSLKELSLTSDLFLINSFLDSVFTPQMESLSVTIRSAEFETPVPRKRSGCLTQLKRLSLLVDSRWSLSHDFLVTFLPPFLEAVALYVVGTLSECLSGAHSAHFPQHQRRRVKRMECAWSHEQPHWKCILARWDPHHLVMNRHGSSSHPFLFPDSSYPQPVVLENLLTLSMELYHLYDLQNIVSNIRAPKLKSISIRIRDHMLGSMVPSSTLPEYDLVQSLTIQLYAGFKYPDPGQVLTLFPCLRRLSVEFLYDWDRARDYIIALKDPRVAPCLTLLVVREDDDSWDDQAELLKRREKIREILMQVVHLRNGSSGAPRLAGQLFHGNECVWSAGDPLLYLLE